MDLSRIRTLLEKKCIKLAQGVDLATLNHFKTVRGLEVDTELLKLYSGFNGFDEYDAKSQILVWSLRLLFDDRNETVTYIHRPYVGFGDFLIMSDTFMCCPTDIRAPIFLLHEGREVSSTMEDFFFKLGLGEFDYL